MNARGRVVLAGAGPGDPGLLTLRAAEALARADVVLHDRLVGPAVLRLARSGALVLPVGKRRGGRSSRQRDIERAMIRHARAGRAVVRLKGGDPFLFGRGGEEAAALARAGVAFEIVPGVSSALAAPAYAGIPLTQRGVSSTVAIVTGHAAADDAEGEPDWELLAHAARTLVVMMGAAAIPRIAARLLRAGLDPATPVAAIRWGTWPRQEVLTAPLAEAATRLAGVAPPAVVVVGEVGRLGTRLGRWFARRPLRGLRVAIVRSREQGGVLARRLEALGAETRQCPVIRTVPINRPAGWTRLRAALGTFRWVMFTSANGVAAFFDLLGRSGRDVRAIGTARIAAVGPGTAEALAEHGLRPDLVPRRHVAEGLAAAWPGPRGARVLLPVAARARPALREALARRGARVDVLPLYRTLPDRRGLTALRRACAAGEVDLIAFSSSSMAEAVLAGRGAVSRRLLRRVRAASIGPITSRTLRRLGMRPVAEARPSTLDGLVAAIVRYHRRRT